MRARHFPDTQDKGTGHGYTGQHQCWLFIELVVKVLAPAVGFLFIGAFEAAETPVRKDVN